MIHFVLHRLDSVQGYLDGLFKPMASQCTAVSWQSLVTKKGLDPGVYVLVGLNRLGPCSRDLLTEFHAAIQGHPGFRVLNHPTRTLGRYELLKKLRDEGINEFSIFGAWEDLSHLRFPVFVRDRSLDGGVPSLLHSMWQVEREIGRALFDGRALDQVVVVEFLDTADDRGVYRKYSAFKIGDQILPVSIDSGVQWVMRDQGAIFTRESLEEEREFLSHNPHQEELKRVFDLAGVEYGRIDYSLHEGRLQTWEINTLPTIEDWSEDSPVPDALVPLQRENEALGYLRLPEALRATVPDLSGKAAIPLVLSADTVQCATSELAASTQPSYPGEVRLGRVRQILQPLKKLLKPVLLSVVLPFVSMGARYRARRVDQRD